MIPLHGIASRSDLPLPFPAVVAGGAAVLVITFYVLFFAWRRSKYAEPGGTPMPRLTRFLDAPAVRIGARVVVGLVWALAALALVAGVDRIDNPVVGFIYVWLWVGLVPAALVLGRVHRATNPIRALLPGAAPRGEDADGSRLPGALALFAFLVMELVLPGGVTLPVLQAATALWLGWLVVGQLARRGWIERADPFEVYGSTVAMMSPWRRIDGVIHRLQPLRNLASWAAPRGTWAVAVVLLGGTAFDAMSNTPWWQRMTQHSELPGWAFGAVGLPLMVVLVGILYALGCAALADRGGLARTMDRLSPGLVPLIVGYCLSHYGTYLYLEGQRTLIRFNDPLGRGDNWFGFVESAPDVSLFAFPTFVAWAQVALIVGGHVLGVLVTHDIALRSPAGRVMRRQLPLLLVMVGFTVAGLLLMFGG